MYNYYKKLSVIVKATFKHFVEHRKQNACILFIASHKMNTFLLTNCVGAWDHLFSMLHRQLCPLLLEVRNLEFFVLLIVVPSEEQY
jgi:hypothetical protein